MKWDALQPKFWDTIPFSRLSIGHLRKTSALSRSYSEPDGGDGEPVIDVCPWWPHSVRASCERQEYEGLSPKESPAGWELGGEQMLVSNDQKNRCATSSHACMGWGTLIKHSSHKKEEGKQEAVR